MRLSTTLLFISLLFGCWLFLLQTGQAQSTDASIAGVVSDQAGKPVPGATVTVKNQATGFQTGTVSNVDGRYSFRQLPLGGPYDVTITFVGFANQQRTGYTINQGDRIVINATLSETPVELTQVNVNARSLTSRTDRLGASTAVTALEIKNLPIINRSFGDLGALSPLSLATGGSPNVGSVGGQLASSTNFTVDGASARNNLVSGAVGNGPYTISLEAIREFEVATNVYDVTQGRQGGGTISVVTKSGTNTLTGSAFYYQRASQLANPNDIRGNKRNSPFSTAQYGFSLGGPIIKDKLHFFVAVDHQDQTENFFIADIQSATDEKALGITKADLNRLISIAGKKYGLDTTRQQVGSFSRPSNANAIFARIDWQLNAKNRLTLRNNYTDSFAPDNTNDNSAINLYESWSTQKSRENSTLLSLRSTLTPSLINELKVQYQHSEVSYSANPLLPSANIPRAIVTISGSAGTTTAQFGGQRFTPELDIANQTQLVNTLYWNKGKFNFTFGTDNTLTYFYNYVSNEQNGRFLFNSLNDLDNLKAAQFAREVPTNGLPAVKQYVFNGSLFAQTQFNPVPNLDAQFGLRYDMTKYLTAADFNPTVYKELGLRTDVAPTNGRLQPRLQLTWNVGGENRNIVRFGAGIFSANPVNYSQLNNIQNSGSKLASVSISRVTNPTGVPTPDFNAYRRDPSTAPGLVSGQPVVSTINLTSPDLKMPTIVKANLSYNHIVSQWLRLGVNLLYSRTTNNYVYLDRNLVDQPYFTLSNEANRGVFVPASTIDPATGQTDNVQSRKSQLVGRTLQFVSAAKLWQAAAVFDAQVVLPRNGSINFSYTWNMAKDNSSYNGNVANTSTFRPIKSDPRNLDEINYSDNDFRHKVVAYATSPTVKGFVLSARFSGLSGTRYSLLVNGDINGDFVGTNGTRNDLAFVFDPNSAETPSAVKDAIAKLLVDPDNRSASYMQQSIGKIADRNGGSNPFYGTMDLRLSKRIKTVGSQAIELSVDAFNFLNLLGDGIDAFNRGLVNNLFKSNWNTDRNWGGNFNLGNQSLLTPTAFNSTTKQYTYRVNANTGKTQRQGTPYQIQLGARYTF